jgi:glycosyltransferase involved in cell wall biosynthesis
MRIVIAHSRLQGFGGGERTVLELLRGLGPRHAVELWAGHYAQERTYPGLQDFPRRDVADWQWPLLRSDADALITHSFGARLLALHSPRVVSYLHTLRARYLRPSLRPDLRLRRRLDLAVVRRSAAILTNSGYTARGIARAYGCDAEVAPPGVDERLFALPERPGDYMLYVGRLAPEKGIERLLAWSAPLALDLVIVGAGELDYERRLRCLAGPRARFRGALTGEALEAAYAGCRFLAFTPHEEELGIVALEAMAAAKPVIATREGGLLELVREGATGFFVGDAAQFAAAAGRLTGSSELSRQLGREGRRLARAYSWERLTLRVEQLCEQLSHAR